MGMERILQNMDETNVRETDAGLGRAAELRAWGNTFVECACTSGKL